MSLPKFPERENMPSREEVINQIISSIAMEELGLSHIINAEGEKLQYALGTIPGVTGPTEPLTMDELLELNKSIHRTLDSTMMNQFFLKEKLLEALSAAVLQGPTGPIGPKGDDGADGAMAAFGAQACLLATGTEIEIQPNGIVIFDTLSADGAPDISYNSSTGIFTINQTGQKSLYMINWWIFVEGSSEAVPSVFAIYEGETMRTKTSCAWPEAQMSGSALIYLEANQINVGISLRNISEDIVTLPDLSDKAQITILGFRRS